MKQQFNPNQRVSKPRHGKSGNYWASRLRAAESRLIVPRLHLQAYRTGWKHYAINISRTFRHRKLKFYTHLDGSTTLWVWKFFRKGPCKGCICVVVEVAGVISSSCDWLLIGLLLLCTAWVVCCVELSTQVHSSFSAHIARTQQRQGISLSINQSVNQSVSQSISQSVSLSINQSINQSVSLSIIQSINQSVSLSIIQSVNQSVNKSVNHSISQSVYQSINQSISR